MSGRAQITQLEKSSYSAADTIDLSSYEDTLKRRPESKGMRSMRTGVSRWRQSLGMLLESSLVVCWDWSRKSNEMQRCRLFAFSQFAPSYFACAIIGIDFLVHFTEDEIKYQNPEVGFASLLSFSQSSSPKPLPLSSSDSAPVDGNEIMTSAISVRTGVAIRESSDRLHPFQYAIDNNALKMIIYFGPRSENTSQSSCRQPPHRPRGLHVF